MAGFEDFRVFVGGLSWDTSDKGLEQAFRRFGKVVEAKVMLDRDTGRPRGFGFVTFGDEQSMEDAIAELHNRELDGRTISVTKAQPKMVSRGGDYGYGGGYNDGGGRGEFSRGGGGKGEECFKCGKLGHWARECPFGGGGGRFPPRYSGGGRNDRYGGGAGYSGRYGERERGIDRERERYPRDRYVADRYGDSYGREGRGGYDRDDARGSARYGSGGPARFERNYRDRSGPYERPSGRSSYDDRY